MRRFIDNSIAPIIAIDFDGTIITGKGYPDPHGGTIRPYAKSVINFLYDVGVKVVIWTNRKNVKDTDIKDKLLMKQWLDEMDVHYHTVNNSNEFAPFRYHGRKLYAHMFVDDRSFGFNYDDKHIMIRVLHDFLENIVGCDINIVHHICYMIFVGNEPDEDHVQHIKSKITNWNKDVPAGTPYKVVGEGHA